MIDDDLKRKKKSIVRGGNIEKTCVFWDPSIFLTQSHTHVSFYRQTHRSITQPQLINYRYPENLLEFISSCRCCLRVLLLLLELPYRKYPPTNESRPLLNRDTRNRQSTSCQRSFHQIPLGIIEIQVLNSIWLMQFEFFFSLSLSLSRASSAD